MPTRSKAKLLTLGLLAAGILAAGFFLLSQRSDVPSAEEQFEQAIAALNRGDLEQANAIREALEEIPGFQNHARFLRGAVLLKNQKHEEALTVLSKISPTGSLREPTLLLRGESLYWLGRSAESVRILRTVVSENPDAISAHRWLGAIYYDLGAYDHAIVELEAVIRLAPDDYRPHRLIGLMRLDFEEHQKAIDHYRKALELSPPKVARQQISRDLAKAHIAKKEYAAALKVLDGVDESAEDLALIGECHWSLGDKKRAKKLLDKAEVLDANSRAVLFLKARILRADGSHEMAIDPLKKILQRDPHDAKSRYQLALAYRQLQRQEDYQREHDRWKQSMQLMERLTKLNIEAIQRPQDAAIRDELSDICNKLGKKRLSQMWKQAADASRQLGVGRSKSSSLKTL